MSRCGNLHRSLGDCREGEFQSVESDFFSMMCRVVLPGPVFAVAEGYVRGSVKISLILNEN